MSTAIQRVDSHEVTVHVRSHSSVSVATVSVIGNLTAHLSLAVLGVLLVTMAAIARIIGALADPLDAAGRAALDVTTGGSDGYDG